EISTVRIGPALIHFLLQNVHARTGTTEETDLPTPYVRGEQVDDLDPGLEHLGLGLQMVEGGRGAVDGPALGDLELLTLGEVESFADHVEDLALGDVADRHGDRFTGVGDFRPAHEAV